MIDLTVSLTVNCCETPDPALVLDGIRAFLVCDSCESRLTSVYDCIVTGFTTDKRT